MGLTPGVDYANILTRFTQRGSSRHVILHALTLRTAENRLSKFYYINSLAYEYDLLIEAMICFLNSVNHFALEVESSW